MTFMIAGLLMPDWLDFVFMAIGFTALTFLLNAAKALSKPPKPTQQLKDYQAKANRRWVMEKPNNVRWRKRY